MLAAIRKSAEKKVKIPPFEACLPCDWHEPKRLKATHCIPISSTSCRTFAIASIISPYLLGHVLPVSNHHRLAFVAFVSLEAAMLVCVWRRILLDMNSSGCFLYHDPPNFVNSKPSVVIEKARLGPKAK